MQTSFKVEIFWDGKIKYRLLESYTFSINDFSIIVPKGYVTDFATVPRFLWSVLPPLGKHNPAALVHDYMYDNRVGSRYFADRVFLDLMLQYNVNRAAAYTMYWGVRMFGKKWWEN